MLSSQGFDLWADGYDRSVCLSEEQDEYPFAGYKRVLGTIYDAIRSRKGNTVLDVGFGTGVLSKKLYDDGYAISGIDFSEKMIEIARAKMPHAELIRHDFAKGFPAGLDGRKFDAIVCTYAIHHLDDVQKRTFLHAALDHLVPGGKLLIGDVAFATRAELEACRTACADAWDDDEIYPVVSELRAAFPDVQFEQITYCSGVLQFGR